MIKKQLIAGAILVSTSAFALTPIPYRLDFYRHYVELVEYLPVKVSKTSIFNIDYKEGYWNSVNINLDNKNCFIDYIEELEPKEEVKSHIEQLKDKINSLQNRIETLKVEIKRLESLDFNNKNDLNNTLIFLDKSYFQKLEEKRKLEKQLSKLENELDDFEIKNGYPFKVKISCPSNLNLKLIFTSSPKEIFFIHKYIISGYTDDKTISIDNKLYIEQETGRDLKNIEINYYTYRKIAEIEPSPFNIKRKSKTRGMLKGIGGTQRWDYEKTETKTYFSVKNVSLPNNRFKEITLSHDTYKADFEIFIDGYDTVTPFLMAKFKSTKIYPKSHRASYFIDGVFLGEGELKTISDDGYNKIYFGEDVFVKTSKVMLKDYEKESLFGKKTHKKEWKYIIKNNHDSKTKITLVDKVPVSKNDKTKVKPFSTFKWKEITPDGKVIWEFYLNPKEEISFKYGYKIINKK